MSDLEVIANRLFLSNRPLFAEEMERGQPPEALAIVLVGRCHPFATLRARALGKKEGGPGLELRCASCTREVVKLATVAPPVLSPCACGRDVHACYVLASALVRLRCPACSWGAEYAVRRGAAVVVGTPASMPAEENGPRCPSACGARLDAVFPSGHHPAAGAKVFCRTCGELAVYTAPNQVRAGTAEDLAGDPIGQQLAELAKHRAAMRRGAS